MLVLAASEHRQPAFEAASFLMDYLKTRAPFWKKEHRADGSKATGSRRRRRTTAPRETGSASKASPCSARASRPASPPSSQLIWSLDHLADRGKRRAVDMLRRGPTARSASAPCRNADRPARPATRITAIGSLPSTVPSARSSGSVSIVARPLTRSVSSIAGHEEEHPDAAVLQDVFQRIEAVVAGKIRDRPASPRRAPSRSPAARRAEKHRRRPRRRWRERRTATARRSAGNAGRGA